MDNKTIGLLGGLGVISLLVGGVVGSVGNLAGLVLLLIAYYYLGEKYGKEVWNKILISIILPFAGILVGVLLGFLIYFMVENIFVAIILPGLLIFTSLIFSGKYNYEANKIVGKESGENLFEKGGFLIFIGAITSIILIGFLISLVGQILICIGFFKFREKGK